MPQLASAPSCSQAGPPLFQGPLTTQEDPNVPHPIFPVLVLAILV